MAGTELKVILVISSLITIAGGGVILYFTLTELNGYKDLWDYINENINKYAIYGMCAFAGATILTGLVGLVGVLKRNRCLLAIFNILAVVLCAIFIAIGVGITIFTNNQYQDLKDIKDCNQASSDYNWLKESNSFYNMLGVYFCTGICQCYVENKGEFPANTFNASFLINTKIFSVRYRSRKHFNKKIVLLKILKNLTKQQNKQATTLVILLSSSNVQLQQLILNTINTSLQFNSLKTNSNVLVFAILNHSTSSPILIEVHLFILKAANKEFKISMITFSTGGFFFLQIIFALWLCCMKKSNGNSDYYSRLYN